MTSGDQQLVSSSNAASSPKQSQTSTTDSSRNIKDQYSSSSLLSQPQQQQQQQQMQSRVSPKTPPPECAGCHKPILERFLLKALDRVWHEDCLKCSCCNCRLGEIGSTLFTKADLILCKRDYLR